MLLIIFTTIGLVFQRSDLGRRIAGVRALEGRGVER